MWEERYVVAYKALLDSFCDVVVGQLFGHFHSEEFRADPTWCTPLLLTSSISPVYNANPSYRAVTYNKTTFEFSDFCVHASPLGAVRAWNQTHCARRYYGLRDLGVRALRAAALALTESCAALQPFLRVYKEGFDFPCTDPARWRCLLATVAPRDYAVCIANGTIPGGEPPADHGSSYAFEVAAAVGIGLALVGLVAAAAAIRRRGRREVGYELVPEPLGVGMTRV
jgi:sphingomyelin phosphodiesterase acid-like 3